MNVVKMVLAILLAFFGIIIIAGTLIQIFDNDTKHTVTTNLVACLLFGVLPLILGIKIYFNVKNKARNRQYEKYEKQILQLAHEKQGKLSYSDIAMNTGLTMEESKGIMRQFSTNGYATLQITDEGTVYYEFLEIMAKKERIRDM